MLKIMRRSRHSCQMRDLANPLSNWPITYLEWLLPWVLSCTVLRNSKWNTIRSVHEGRTEVCVREIENEIIGGRSKSWAQENRSLVELCGFSEKTGICLPVQTVQPRPRPRSRLRPTPSDTLQASWVVRCVRRLPSASSRPSLGSCSSRGGNSALCPRDLHPEHCGANYGYGDSKWSLKNVVVKVKDSRL